MNTVEIKTDFIKADQLLKFSGVALTGGEAKLMIEDGIIFLNGEEVTQRGKKIFPGDAVVIKADDGDIVLKIEKDVH